MKKENLEGKSLYTAMLIIMEELPQKAWTPYELQRQVKTRTGTMFSESGITAALRKHKIPATMPVDRKVSKSWTYKFTDQK